MRGFCAICFLPARDFPIFESHIPVKPCRDCGNATAPSARSCPSCGILNPVLQWVALPDGSHHTARVAVTGGAGLAPFSPAPAYAGAAGNAAAMAGATFKLQGRAAQREGVRQHFAGVADSDDALQAIRTASTRFFLLAALSLVVGYLSQETTGSLWYLDGLVVGGLALALREMHSRVAAGLLLAMSVIIVLAQVVALMAGVFLLGRMIVWVIMSGISYRALLATMSLHRSRTAAVAMA